MLGDPIILVNRTSLPLQFVADGRFYTLQPGDNHGYVRGHAQFAMQQHPLMGSEDYYSLEFESLIGIKGETPCDEIPDDVLQAVNEQEAERFNRERSGLRSAIKVKPRHRVPTGRSGGVTSAANANAYAIGG